MDHSRLPANQPKSTVTWRMRLSAAHSLLQLYPKPKTLTAIGCRLRAIFSWAIAGTDASLDPEFAFERERNPLAGNGGGQTTIVTRRHLLLHPRGIKFTKSSMAGKSPTYAELATTANWDRVFERKKIRLAALEVN